MVVLNYWIRRLQLLGLKPSLYIPKVLRRVSLTFNFDVYLSSSLFMIAVFITKIRTSHIIFFILLSIINLITRATVSIVIRTFN